MIIIGVGLYIIINCIEIVWVVEIPNKWRNTFSIINNIYNVVTIKTAPPVSQSEFQFTFGTHTDRFK